jgi:hypothetical protein
MRHRRIIIAATLLLLCAVAAVFAAGALVPGGAPNANAADQVVLTVKDDGRVVKQYTLTELEAVTPYSGYAGFITSGGTVNGPDPVVGVKIADVLKDAFGTAMTSQQSVDVHAPDDYGMTYSYDQVVNASGFDMISTVTKKVEAIVGPLSAVLVYERAGLPLPADEGSLRFYAAQPTAAAQVMDGSLSVYDVSLLNLRDQAVPEWGLKLVGLKIKGKRQIVTEARNAIEGCSRPGCHGRGVAIAGARWSGVPLWRLMGVVDGGASHKGHSYNAALARKGYRIRLYNAAGKYVTISSKVTPFRNSIIVANQVGGAVPGAGYYPLRLVGPAKYVPAAKRLGRITKIVMLPLK